MTVKFEHTLQYHPHSFHDDVIKWKHFPRYCPFVQGIHRSQVNSPHKDPWCGALMFSLISAWINCWINNHEAGDLRRHHTHYDVIVMQLCVFLFELCYIPESNIYENMDAILPRSFTNFRVTTMVNLNLIPTRLNLSGLVLNSYPANERRLSK